MVSFIKRANPAAVAATPCSAGTSCPTTSACAATDDGLAMELVGDGVKLVGEDELVTAGGERQAAAAGANGASQAFVTSFTKKYPELAERSPVYAELRNVIDLAVAAAYIQQQDYYGKAGWKMALFGDEQEFAVETCNAPKHGRKRRERRVAEGHR